MKPAFEKYETLCEVVRRQGKDVDQIQLASEAVQRFGKYSVDAYRTMVEAVAFGHGPPPMFKVFPDIMETLSQCEFRIDGSDLTCPFEFFLVCLPTGNKLRYESAYKPITAILVYKHGDKLSALVQSESDEGRPDKPTGQYRIIIKPDEQVESQVVEQCLNLDLRKPESEHPRKFGFSDEMLISDTLRWLRVIIGVSLLATSGDKLIEKDVLSADIQRYIEARRKDDEPRQRAIENRCEKRRGQVVFTVGREATRPLYSRANDDDSDGDGRELTHQHLRRAHFRKLSSGKVVFIRHTVVRPDLPSAGRQPIYNLD